MYESLVADVSVKVSAEFWLALEVPSDGGILPTSFGFKALALLSVFAFIADDRGLLEPGSTCLSSLSAIKSRERTSAFSGFSAANWKLSSVLAGLLTGEPSAVWNEFATLLDVRECAVDIDPALRCLDLVGDILMDNVGCWRVLLRSGDPVGLFHRRFEGEP
jgi:hypothetical protein